MQNIDKAVDDLFTQVPISGLQISDKRKEWQGNTMHFAFTGRMGFFSAPIYGTVTVTDRDVTLDVELPGILKKFIPEEKIRAQMEGSVRALIA